MNFVRITFWPPPGGLRSTGTNVRWAFKEKQDCQWLRCTLCTSSSEQSHDRIYCGHSLNNGSQMWFAWLTFVCVCARARARVCMRVCSLSLSLQSILLRQPGNRSNKFSHKQTTLFINHSSHFENLLPPENHLWNEPFFLFFYRLGDWNGGISTLMVIDWHFETSETKGNGSGW